MEEEFLYQFQRKENELVCLRLKEYKRRKYIDLRIFYKPEDDDQMRPTKKGITLAIELLPQLKKGIIISEQKVLNHSK